jgi:glycosyl-4,4'-diaponeurosporenoate acyltransferase
MFGSALFFYFLPQKNFNLNSFLFKPRSWENSGLFYEKTFFIKKWKKLLPDGASLFKNGFKKKHLNNFSTEYLDKFVYESCRAEATHFPPIFLSFVFALYNNIGIVIFMFLFSIITNLPCIITQRYNRIRLLKIINKKRNK